MNANSRLPRADPSRRLNHIINVAADEFGRSGYGSTSMAKISASLGGSKATLYKYFRSKKSLFEEVIRNKSSHVIADLRDSPEKEKIDFESLLTVFGKKFLENLLTDEAIQIFRMVHGDGVRFPEAAAAFHRNGPEVAYAALTLTIERYTFEGLIDCPQPRLAAEQFIGMLRSDIHLKVAIGAARRPTDVEIEKHVAHAARVFSRGLALSPKIPTSN